MDREKAGIGAFALAAGVAAALFVDAFLTPVATVPASDVQEAFGFGDTRTLLLAAFVAAVAGTAAYRTWSA